MKSEASSWGARLGWISLVVILAWWATCQWRERPELYKRCESPDGTWTVELYRAWEGPSVRLEAKTALRDGSGSSEHEIDLLDMWNDAEERYPELICENEQARIGPGGGANPRYRVLRKPHSTRR